MASSSSSNNGACSVFGSGSISISGSSAPPPSFYLDEKWKLSKKESLSRSCRYSSSRHWLDFLDSESRRERGDEFLTLLSLE
ncbi:hypothetical protein TorRG33x02_146100 [Trema orientale]|uniref:Uncharacterized protein n=1 Tax=Trema orientale TaxID=63057 RepID=A0A2P5EVR5_TREOI|nr:hypothetical protein TorRG33x02_146100 [Trema orientale]